MPGPWFGVLFELEKVEPTFMTGRESSHCAAYLPTSF